MIFLLCCLASGHDFRAFGQASEYNAIYRGEEGAVFSVKPNAFLVEMTRARKSGKALDVGMGQGRNSIWLAQQGWDVTGFDPADAGVAVAKATALRLGLKMHAIVTTFEEFDFGENQWDLIVLTYEPTRAIAPKVVKALKPGGAVLVEDRHLESRRVWPGGTFENNELTSLFAGLRVLRYEDVWAPADWSSIPVDQRLVRLFAEKPLAREAGCLWKGKQLAETTTVCWHSVTFYCGPHGWEVQRGKCKEE
ncbi:MAG: class I SAM-dependent methyltransferase [Bryobacteraceae bacterium]|nr:class I SAM-dependent methyltransferase [Bryobacteraceae bacterium]